MESSGVGRRSALVGAGGEVYSWSTFPELKSLCQAFSAPLSVTGPEGVTAIPLMLLGAPYKMNFPIVFSALSKHPLVKSENGNPHQYSCLENLMDRGAWQAIVHRVTKSWTQLSDQYFHYFSWITLGNNMKSIDLHAGL